MTPAFITVLAAAEGGVVFAIIMIISVISWIVNLFKENQAKSKKPATRTRQEKQGPSELEIFLQEVSGKAPPEKQRPQQRPAEKRPAQQKPVRTAADNKKGGKSRQPQQQQPVAARPAADRPGARLAQSHLATAGLGDALRSHVSSHLEPRNVDNQVTQDVDNRVQKDIGADGTITTIRRQPVHPLVLALRNPEGARQAILMAEILRRPRSIRS
ncbi:MAG: hypothetical protein JSS49_14250 [Planctomycetes bacterium]|nr:hypothetical protein [Planctomycetota bacterium]